MLFQSAQKERENRTEDLLQYQKLLSEVEKWLADIKLILQQDIQDQSLDNITNTIRQYEESKKELKTRIVKLENLIDFCEPLQDHTDTETLVKTLLDQLRTTLVVLKDTDCIFTTKITELKNTLIKIQQVQVQLELSTEVDQIDSLTDNTLDSSPMPEEETPFKAAQVKPIQSQILKSQEFITMETQTGKSLRSPSPKVKDAQVSCVPPNDVHVQTGKSLCSPEPPHQKDVAITCAPPNDVHVQTGHSLMTPEPEMKDASITCEPPHDFQVQTDIQPVKTVVYNPENLKITKTTSEGHETIEIASKPLVQDPDTKDSLLVEAKYKGDEGDDIKNSLLNITHSNPQSFETVMVEPDETTTEVIVDADGTKRIIVRKVRKTLIARQHTVQQQQIQNRSTITTIGSDLPTESFSQVTLQGQQSSTMFTDPTGNQQTTQTHGYGGQIISGTPGGEVHIHEFTSKPECMVTFKEGSTPEEMLAQGLQYSEFQPSEITFQNIENPTGETEVHTSSSSVRAVVQQVTRRIVRRTRRIIKRIVIIDGKEHITEEIVEEPEEVDITQEDIPRVTINVTRTVDGQVVASEHFHPNNSGAENINQPLFNVHQQTSATDDTVNFEQVDSFNKPINYSLKSDNITISEIPDEDSTGTTLQRTDFIPEDSTFVVSELVSPELKSSTTSELVFQENVTPISEPCEFTVTQEVNPLPDINMFLQAESNVFKVVPSNEPIDRELKYQVDYVEVKQSLNKSPDQTIIEETVQYPETHTAISEVDFACTPVSESVADVLLSETQSPIIEVGVGHLPVSESENVLPSAAIHSTIAIVDIDTIPVSESIKIVPSEKTQSAVAEDNIDLTPISESKNVLLSDEIKIFKLPEITPKLKEDIYSFIEAEKSNVQQTIPVNALKKESTVNDIKIVESPKTLQEQVKVDVDIIEETTKSIPIPSDSPIQVPDDAVDECIISVIKTGTPTAPEVVREVTTVAVEEITPKAVKELTPKIAEEVTPATVDVTPETITEVTPETVKIEQKIEIPLTTKEVQHITSLETFTEVTSVTPEAETDFIESVLEVEESNIKTLPISPEDIVSSVSTVAFKGIQDIVPLQDINLFLQAERSNVYQNIRKKAVLKDDFVEEQNKFLPGTVLPPVVDGNNILIQSENIIDEFEIQTSDPAANVTVEVVTPVTIHDTIEVTCPLVSQISEEQNENSLSFVPTIETLLTSQEHLTDVPQESVNQFDTEAMIPTIETLLISETKHKNVSPIKQDPTSKTPTAELIEEPEKLPEDRYIDVEYPQTQQEIIENVLVLPTSDKDSSDITVVLVSDTTVTKELPESICISEIIKSSEVIDDNRPATKSQSTITTEIIVSETVLPSLPIETVEKTKESDIPEPKPMSILKPATNQFLMFDSEKLIAAERGVALKDTTKRKVQLVEFNLTLQETPILAHGNQDLTASIKVENEQNISEAQSVIKGVNVDLPYISETVKIETTSTKIASLEPTSSIESKSEYDESPRDGIEIGGKRNRKRKKHKLKESEIKEDKYTLPLETETVLSATSPDGDGNAEPISIETTLAESIDIAIPSESEAPETPQPTFIDVLDSLSPRSEESKEHETGYEPDDITTVDDNSAIQKDPKTKHKIKRRQKIKNLVEESSDYPKSISDDDTHFSDDNEDSSKPIQHSEPSDKQRKKKKKSKKVSVELPEPDTQDEEHHESPVDITTEQVEPSLVIEEPIVIDEPVPVIDETPVEIVEVVHILTSDHSVQTSLETVYPETIKHTVETLETFMQTSPDVNILKSEVSGQTSPEVVPIATEHSQQTSPVCQDEVPLDIPVIKELFESTTQVTTYDIMIPEEKFSQTSSPIVQESFDIDVQTVSPKTIAQPTQTSPVQSEDIDIVPVIESISKEVSEYAVQTSSIAVTDQPQQTSPVDIPETEDLSIQTTLSKSPELCHEGTQVQIEFNKPTSEISIQTSQVPSPEKPQSAIVIETVELSTQTTPIPKEFSDETLSSSSLSKDEPYEVHFHAQITLPNEKGPNISQEFIVQEADYQFQPIQHPQETNIDFDHSEMLCDDDIIMDKNKRVKKKKRNKRKPISELEDKISPMSPESFSDPISSEFSMSSSSSKEFIHRNKDISADEGISPNIGSSPFSPGDKFIIEGTPLSTEEPGYGSKISYSQITKGTKSPIPVKFTEEIKPLNVPTNTTSEETLVADKSPENFVLLGNIEFNIVPSQTSKTTDSVTLIENESLVRSSEPTVKKPKDEINKFISSEITEYSPSTSQTYWDKTNNTIEEKVKNMLQNRKTKNFSNPLVFSKLKDYVSEIPKEQYDCEVKDNLVSLNNAVKQQNIVVIETTVITTVETILVWLERIEYIVYCKRQQMSEGPNPTNNEDFDGIKEELNTINKNVETLKQTMKDLTKYPEENKTKMNECLNSLQEQIEVVQNITKETENQSNIDNTRWQEFLNGAKNVQDLVLSVKQELDQLLLSDIPNKTKLEKLDQLESSNHCHMLKTAHQLQTARGLVRDFPGKELLQIIYTTHELTKQIENSVNLERDRLLQLLALADEYEQTLREFEQITDIADALVESRINVINLEHLQEEMQKHRKFFVNLSHCRAILESLEGNLDNETRALHSALHHCLHDTATNILDKAASRAQQMALAASRWTVLEQGMKAEKQWLQVAHQRVPDLSSVTSSEYDQYITLYQSLLLDISHHHAKLLQLLGIANGLEELVSCSSLHGKYNEPLEVVLQLQDEVNGHMRRLVAFRENWTEYDMLTDRLETWMKKADKEISHMAASPAGTPGNMRHFWELKAQHEVHNNIRNNAAVQFEQAMEIIPISDEMVQRQFFSRIEDKWRNISAKIDVMHSAAIENISAPDAPVDEKLIILEDELRELKLSLNELQGIIKSEDELNLYIERLQILSGRIETIQNELGRLGMLPALESERVGGLLSQAHRLEILISEELEGGLLLKEKLATIQIGLSRMRKNHQKVQQTLDECEANEKMGSDVVEQALINCQTVGEDLVSQWQDLLKLRQLLHTLPVRLRVSVSPVKVEREISQLQDNHSALESRCGNLLGLLRNRLGLWRRFERQLEMVQQSVQEADFMIELLTVQGQVDYDRLLKATERLEVST